MNSELTTLQRKDKIEKIKAINDLNLKNVAPAEEEKFVDVDVDVEECEDIEDNPFA